MIETPETALWEGPDWTCPHCQSVNLAVLEICHCGYDSNAGEFPWYGPLPPYEGLTEVKR
jgi:hypothetical protein